MAQPSVMRFSKPSPVSTGLFYYLAGAAMRRPGDTKDKGQPGVKGSYAICLSYVSPANMTRRPDPNRAAIIARKREAMQ